LIIFRGEARRHPFTTPQALHFIAHDCEATMASSSKKRKSASGIKIDPNVRCLRIYPVEDNLNSTKTIAELKTVGIKLSRDQDIHLARLLLAAAQQWDEIDITAWRAYKQQSDCTYNVTVATAIPVDGVGKNVSEEV
jgi:hypothetical protein